MSSTIRRRGPDVDTPLLFALLAGLNVVAACVAAVAVVRFRNTGLAAVVVLAAGAGDFALLWAIRAATRPGDIDDAARYLETPARLVRNTREGVRRAAEDMGYGDLDTPGLFLGTAVRGGRELWATWEDMYVEIAGPGTGKTTARAIPNIIAAPGPVLVTSCKHHIVEATRAIRERRGRTWVFDPQNVSGERPTWYWSPLDMVGGSLKDATTVAGLFMSTQRMPHHRTDAYFEPAAQSLISLVLFAAEQGGRPITDCLKWLMRPEDDTPLEILRGVDRHDLAVSAMEGMSSLPATQRAGVYATAQQYMNWLAVPDIIRWITPGEGREEFQFVSFSRESTDTLYVMSKSGDKMASPAVSCITAAVAVAGETGSSKRPGGRLQKPLLVVLDEPSNVAQLAFWPNRYSHFGSRGVIVMTMLQSWAQGVDQWGAGGMAKLWGAANIRVYGGGGTEARTLDDPSLMAGRFEAPTRSLSHSGNSIFGTVTRASRSESILHPSDIANLPRGRLLIQISGQRPVLATSTHWADGPYAEEIRASIEEHHR